MSRRPLESASESNEEAGREKPQQQDGAGGNVHPAADRKEEEPDPKRVKILAGVEQKEFGRTASGEIVHMVTMRNATGLVAKIISLGASLVELHVPDKNNEMRDVVLGFDTAEAYAENKPYLGSICGRYGNRIANGKFTLGDKEHQLETNNGPNCLHGGFRGFNKANWSVSILSQDDPTVVFTMVSLDGDCGFPGELATTVVYTLTRADELRIHMSSSTLAPTVVNLVSHTYWNLAGHNSGDVLRQELQVNADAYTPTDEHLIPTGETASVNDTCLDFRVMKPIGRDIAQLKDDQPRGGGYDHNFALRSDVNNEAGSVTYQALVTSLPRAAVAKDPDSGVQMELFTNMPGVQLYTGNWLDIPGKGGAAYKKFQGFCLETQYFPDAPNKPQFVSPVLKPGGSYEHVMIHRFTVQR